MSDQTLREQLAGLRERLQAFKEARNITAKQIGRPHKLDGIISELEATIAAHPVGVESQELVDICHDVPEDEDDLHSAETCRCRPFFTRSRNFIRVVHHTLTVKPGSEGNERNTKLPVVSDALAPWILQ